MPSKFSQYDREELASLRKVAVRSIERDCAWLAKIDRRIAFITQGIEARSDTTRSGVAEGESPVPQGCATHDTPNPESSHV